MPLRVLLVDDHPLFRAGVIDALRSAPDILVCAESDNASEARALAARLKPDTAIIDLILQDDDGLKLVRELRQDFPKMRIIVLSMLKPEIYRDRAMQAGANTFVAKRDGPEAVVAALRHPAPGSVRPPARATELSMLSERELQVFLQLGQGRSTQEITAALGVSRKTVGAHRENIKNKLGLPHTNALVARATLWVREQGLTR